MRSEKEFYIEQLRRGRIGRREFVGRMTALGITAAVVPSLLANSARAQTPKRGGKLLVGGTAVANDSLDPARFNSINGFCAGLAVYDHLVGRDANLRPTPWLAESWESNADATEWTFKLRGDVTFHDGQAFGAEDVAFTFSRIVADDSTSPLKAVFSHVGEIKVDDPRTLRFVLTSPDVDFALACGDHRAAVVRRGQTDFTSTVGTGPFKVVSYAPGELYRVERNDEYWGDDGPWVDEIDFIAINDLTARLNALLSGDVHVIGGLDPAAVDLINRRDDLELITSPSTTPISATMMLDRSPTSDPDLRLALKFAVDRERIVENVYKGLAHIGNDHTISPLLADFCGAIEQRVYDPERARFHIRKAGLENVPIDFHTADVYPGLVAATEVFQQDADAAGIKINVVRSPVDTYWDTVWMNDPLCMAYWDGRPSASIMFSTVFHSGSPWNETAWQNETFDAILTEARGTLDDARRQEMYCELQSMLQDDGGHSTWVHTNYNDARRSEVQGITPHPSGNLGFFKLARTVWLDT